MLDEELQPGQSARREAKPFADLQGDDGAVLRVVAALQPLAGVVQEQGEVEQVRLVDVLQDVGVMDERRLLCVPDLVEFLEADQRVFIGCIGVKELVLHEAGHPAKLRDVEPKQSDFVHGAQGGGDAAAPVEDLEERLAHFRVVDEALVHQRHAVAEQLGQVGVNVEAALLRVEEDAHEPMRLFLEHTRRARQQLAIDDVEAVKRLRFFAPTEKRAQGGQAAGWLGTEGQPALDHAGDEMDRPQVRVQVAHERLQPPRRRAVLVAKLPGHLRLQRLGQIVHESRGLIMQLVAGAQQEVVAGLKLLAVPGADHPLGLELLERVCAVLEVGHPQQILVVAQTAAAVLDVGLLQQGGVAELHAARVLVANAHLQVGVDVVADAPGLEALLKLPEQRGVAGDEASLDQRRLGLHVVVGDVDRILNVAHRVADLHPEVVQRVDQAAGAGELFKEWMAVDARQRRHRAVVQQHDVDVAVGVEFRAPVTPDRDKRNLEPARAAGRPEGCERPVEQRAEQCVDHLRPAKADLEAAAAVAMQLLQAG